MMDISKGKYWDESWNPVIGCTKCGPGCQNCYAEKLHTMRHNAYLGGKKLPKQYAKPFSEIQLLPERLDAPLHLRKPRTIFVCNMSDLFHPNVPFEFITQVFDMMCSWKWPNKAAEREGDEFGLVSPGHKYLVLTKRPERFEPWLDWVGEFWRGDSPFNVEMEVGGKIPPHIYFGVTVCNQQEADEKIPQLLQIPTAHRWVSIEPCLGEIDLRPHIGDYMTTPIGPSLDWGVVGAESGPHKRYCPIENIESVVQQGKTVGVPVFVKQVHLPKIIAVKNVKSEIPVGVRPFVVKGKTYRATENKHGAISAITQDGLLGLKPDEFRKAGFWLSKDPSEWPEELRIREMPE